MKKDNRDKYRLPHEDNQDDIAFYGALAVGVFAILMILGGFI